MPKPSFFDGVMQGSVAVAYMWILFIVCFMSGCSELQKVCPTGDETAAIEYAVEYWADRGFPVMISEDSECTIRTRIAPTLCPDEPNTAGAMHCMNSVVESSHTFQSEIRFRSDYWAEASDVTKLYMAVHELGHVWFGHTETGVMQAWMPESNTERQELLKAE
jgi:hypothetical protein